MQGFRILPRNVDGSLFSDPDISVESYRGGRLSLVSKGSFFFAVAAGRALINGYPVRPGMYGSLPRLCEIEGDQDGRMLLVETKSYPAMFALGGPIEPIGRLRYIDGCTDTGLIAPPRLGDPCLNALFFPARTRQTAHTHPSHRVGIIYSGEGRCITPEAGATPMRQGDIFIIPQDTVHHFETDASDMRIMVFHPDSEFGPTDERHQMLDATVIA